MSKLLDYLNHLDKDAAARETHQKNPSKAMKAFGLTDEEHDAVLKGDTKKVSQLTGVAETSLRAIHSVIRLP